MRRLFYSIIFLFAILSFQTVSFSQSFTLVRDVNLGSISGMPRPLNLIEAGGSLFFDVDSGPAAGFWKSDGTAGGTQRLKATSDPEKIETIGKLNNQAFFTIYNSDNASTSLWKSDGTGAGTILLQSWSGSRVEAPVVINEDIFFVIKTGSNYELYKSDGTPGGITILKPGAYVIENLVDVNGALFFTAIEPSPPYQHKLWKSDGTIAGTVLVKEIFAGSGNPYFNSVYNANGTLYFGANDGVNGPALWKSDGTGAGTVMIKNIQIGSTPDFIRKYAMINNTLYFTTASGNNLWKSDGTSAGTVIVKDLSFNNYSYINYLVNVGDVLYFDGYDNTNGSELWKSDGTTAGTVMVKAITPGGPGAFSSSITSSLFNANGVLFFAVDNGINGTELWKSDGTEAGTLLLKDVNQVSGSSDPGGFASVNGITFFAAFDGVNGRELWKTDGTTNGTSLVKNIIPSPSNGPQNFTVANNRVYFIGFDGDGGPGYVNNSKGIYQTDGTFSGTGGAEKINLSDGGSMPYSVAAYKNEFYYAGKTATDGHELWKIPANGGNATRIKNINTKIISGVYETGSNPGYLGYLTSTGQFLFFSADDGNSGNELWKSDGTEAGTSLVKDIYPGALSSFPTYPVNMNGVLYFTANNGTDGNELWKSDGTEAGTVMVKNINPGFNSSNPSLLTAVNGTLFFGAGDGIHGYELWKSDGTEAGTVLVKDINGLPTTSNLEWFTNINGILYFTANDGIHGAEPWKSDGTEAGTVLLKDISAGPSGSNPDSYTDLNGIMLFAANDGIIGRELWRSDGTAAGTILVKDIYPGAGMSNPIHLTKVGNNVLFVAFDEVSGSEIWLSNGNESGTGMMGEIQPGAEGSNPTEIFEFGSKVLVAATHELFGYEVWIADVPAGSPLPLDLLEFKGSVVSDDGVLQWKTDNELNTSSFIIERSLDGRSYSLIGSVSAANSSGVHYYDFIDVNIASLNVNTIYYRLKQTDIDGRYTYSHIVVLSIDNNKPIVMLYPNPVKDKLNMTFTVAQNEKLQWQLTDNTGRTIKKGIYNLSAGSTAVSIDIANLDSGIYLVQLNGTTLKKVFKVIKQ